MRRIRRPRPSLEMVVLLGLLAVAALARLWELDSRPGTEWDEPVYADIARSVAEGHGIELKAPLGQGAEPYLFHPPFYFLLLGGWMRLVGSSDIADARMLAALASLVVLAFLYLLVRPRWGMLGAAASTLVLATDGWLIFTNRIGWLENTMLVLLVGGLLAYDRAQRRESTQLYCVAGFLLASAVAFKHIAIYGLAVVAVHWVLTRSRRRGHVVLVGTVAALLAAYLAVMLVAFVRNGHNYFLEDSRVQLERLLGHKESRGSITSWRDAVDAIVGPYKVFVATLAIAAAGGVLAVWHTAAGMVRRDLPRRVADPLLYAWAIVALLFFAALRLKMAHYFVMAQVPLMLYAFAQVARWAQHQRRAVARSAVGGLLLLVLGVNAWTFHERFVERTDDALGATRIYAETLPSDATFVTEESIGTIIRQPYCKLYDAGACVADADYVAIYRSQTQAPPRNATLDRLLAYGTPLVRFEGFKERIVVYRAPSPGAICRPARLGVGMCRLEPSQRRWIADGRDAAQRTAHVSFGPHRRLRELRGLGALAPVSGPQGVPWALLLGMGRDDVASFANLGAAEVSGEGRCRPTPADCQTIQLRPGEAAHLELPRIDGRSTPLELKLRAVEHTSRPIAPSPYGTALLRAATTPRSPQANVPTTKDTP